MAESSTADETPSPCVNVCQLHPEKGYCIGCLRTLDEIADWLDMQEKEKCEVLARLDQRRKAAA